MTPTTHPEGICGRCGQQNVRAWYTESSLWNRITEGSGADRYVTWCPQCFTQEYERQVERLPVWELRLDPPEGTR